MERTEGKSRGRWVRSFGINRVFVYFDFFFRRVGGSGSRKGGSVGVKEKGVSR